MLIMLAAAFMVSLAATAVTGTKLVPALRRRRAGQAIREDGPVWHNEKKGTPTMGGVMFITGITLSSLTLGAIEAINGAADYIIILIILAFAIICAAVGFLDDYEKLKKKQNQGLTARKKFALQVIAAAAFVLLMRLTGYTSTGLYIPFFNIVYQIPEVPYFIFAVFVVAGTINAVNITDGVDGLATGVSIPVAICYISISVLWGCTSLGIFSAALAGGLTAFLFFNFHPAKVFMGDTGAQFLGGAISAIAFAMDMPLILLPLGIVFFIETLSDIIQVSYFKITKGKRVFKMAPLHHHFEMSGWSEYKIFVVFTAVSSIFAVISYIGVINRY